MIERDDLATAAQGGGTKKPSCQSIRALSKATKRRLTAMVEDLGAFGESPFSFHGYVTLDTMPEDLRKDRVFRLLEAEIARSIGQAVKVTQGGPWGWSRTDSPLRPKFYAIYHVAGHWQTLFPPLPLDAPASLAELRLRHIRAMQDRMAVELAEAQRQFETALADTDDDVGVIGSRAQALQEGFDDLRRRYSPYLYIANVSHDPTDGGR